MKISIGVSRAWDRADLRSMNNAFCNAMAQIRPKYSVPVKVNYTFDRRWTMRGIAKMVCDKYDVSLEELRGPRRYKSLVAARHELMWRIKTELPHCSYPQIGRFLNRDHTTILYGVRKYEATRRQLQAAE